MQMPPHSMATLPTEFLDFEIGKSLKGRICFDEKFANPLSMFQGGFLAGAIDNVLGPLTYFVAQKAVVTLDMSISYLRPFTAKDEYIDILGEVVMKSKNVLFLKAEVRNKDGKLLATSSQHAIIRE